MQSPQEEGDFFLEKGETMSKRVERPFEQHLGLNRMPVIDRTLSLVPSMDIQQLEQLVRQDMQFLPHERLNIISFEQRIQLMQDLHATRGDFFNNTTIPYEEKLLRVFLEPDAEPGSEQYRAAMEDKLRARRHLAVYFWLRDQGINPPAGDYMDFEGLRRTAMTLRRVSIYDVPFALQGRRTAGGHKLPKSERNLQRLQAKRENDGKKAPKPYLRNA